MRQKCALKEEHSNLLQYFLYYIISQNFWINIDLFKKQAVPHFSNKSLYLINYEIWWPFIVDKNVCNLTWDFI